MKYLLNINIYNDQKSISVVFFILTSFSHSRLNAISIFQFSFTAFANCVECMIRANCCEFPIAS